MKMMDVSMKDSDRDTDVGTSPPAKKKLRQAQLPFQKSGLTTPNSTINKKRKLTSPSVDCKNRKMIRIELKEKDVKNKILKTLIDVKENQSAEENTEIEKDQSLLSSPDSKEDCKRKKPRKVTTKEESKNQEKPGALTRFLQNIDKSPKTTEQNESDKNVNIKNTSNISITKSEDLNQSIISLHENSDLISLSSDNDSNEVKHSSSSEKQNNDTVDSCSDLLKTPKKKSTSKLILASNKKLTPKQLEKQLASAKRKAEVQRIRQERERQKEEERQTRKKEKEDKQKEKEEKLKAEREQKKREKEEKELKKQQEFEQKLKEKEAKEEERRKREEAKEEERRKKQKAASTFVSFFVAKKPETTKTIEEEKYAEVKNFMPFEVKTDMKIAPLCRRVLDEKDKVALDELINSTEKSKVDLYVEQIRRKILIPRKSERTWPLETKDEDITVIEDDDNSQNFVDLTRIVEKLRPKLLQFSGNRRPPYWGTWRKRSQSINPRNPFAKDTKWFDYEIDSDEEWEEEEPGESLRGSDDEREEENQDDNEYDEDHEFLVPHGYLSGEEAKECDEDGEEDMSPEMRKFKLKLLGEEFDAERNSKISKLKPRIIGCIWQGLDNSFPENVFSKTVEFLQKRKAWVHQIPVVLPSAVDADSVVSSESSALVSRTSIGSKKTKVPKEAIPDLIRLVHGNPHGRVFLVKEFIAFWNNKSENLGENKIYKASLSQKIRDIAKWMAWPEEGPMHGRACWYVYEDNRKEYFGDVGLSAPNRWTYTLKPNRKSDFLDQLDKSDKEESEKPKEKKYAPLITQFTRKLTQEEMKTQLISSPTVCLDQIDKSDKEESKTPEEKKYAPLITQFTKKITQEEMKTQLNSSPTVAITKISSPTATKLAMDTTSKQDTVSKTPQLASIQRVPKRATLISVARGEEFNESSRKSLLEKFVNREMTRKEVSVTENDDIDDCIGVSSTSVDNDKNNVKVVDNIDSPKSSKLSMDVDRNTKIKTPINRPSLVKKSQKKKGTIKKKIKSETLKKKLVVKSDIKSTVEEEDVITLD
ncbi:chromatin assembly factor 1 subunit A-B-like isoform X2 [Prorops nasuta]|uniref:chromatin assembly factor 1 subunit A-B-like isoform X2 n=1 Tax=Prorops nasuta TaxID=863751 RepID=UPI0034CD0548